MAEAPASGTGPMLGGDEGGGGDGGDAADRRIAELDGLLAREPDSEAFFVLARLYWQKGRINRAGEVLRGGLQHHPGHVPARLLHAEALILRGKHPSCAREMARLLQRDPELVPAMILLGRALLAQGEVDEALVVLARAAETAPDDAEVARWVELAHLALPVRDEPLAIGVIERNGQVIDLDDADLPAPKPGFTGYIRAIAGPAGRLSGIESLPPLPPAQPRSGPPRSPDAALWDLDSAELAPPSPSGPPPVAQALEILAELDGSEADEDDEDVTRAEDLPPSLMTEVPPPPPHPETGGATREAVSPGLRGGGAGGPSLLMSAVEAAAAQTPVAQTLAARPSASASSKSQSVFVSLPELDDEDDDERTGATPADSIAMLQMTPQPARPVASQPAPAPAAPVGPRHSTSDARSRAAAALPRFDWELPDEPPAPTALAPTAPSLSVPESDLDDDDDDRGSVGRRVIEATHMTAPPEQPVGAPPARPQTVRLARKGVPGASINEEPSSPPPAIQPLLPAPSGAVGREPAPSPSTPGAPSRPSGPPAGSSRGSGPRSEPPSLNAPSIVGMIHTSDLMLESSQGPLTPPGGVARVRREHGGLSDAERPRPTQDSGARQRPAAAPAPAAPRQPAAPVASAPAPAAPRQPAAPVASAPAPHAPQARKPPSAPGPRVDLLDVPIDPSEFDDMPPKPPAVATHAPPADLAALELTGERSAPQAAPKRAPPRSPNPEQPGERPPRAPPPPQRPAANPEPPARRAAPPPDAPPLKPVRAPARAPEPPPPASEPPVAEPPARKPRPRPTEAQPDPPARRAPRPAASPAPEPAAAPAPARAKPAAAPPAEQPRFDSIFDARVDPQRPSTDALGDLVVAQKQRSPATLAAQPVPGPSPNARLLRWVPALSLAVLLLLSLTLTWRYRAATHRIDRAMAAARQKASDATWPGAVAAVNLLTEADVDADPFARLGNALLKLVSRPGLTTRRGDLIALLARFEAQRVATFGETERRDVLRLALQRAQAEAPDRQDTTMAAAWQSIDVGQSDEARRLMEPLATRQTGDAEVRYVTGLASLQAGNEVSGVEHLRAALQADPGHVGALKALADHRASRGEHTAALEAYKQILATYSPDHLETRVALARLQIQLGKRESEAMAELKALSTAPSLSRPQRALVFDALGEAALRRNDLQTARESFLQAQSSAPGDPRYAVGLAALDMRELKLDEAEGVLAEAWRAHPESLLYLQYLVQVRLMRGDPDGALRRLDQTPQLNAALLHLKGRALIETKDPRAAELVLRQARDLDAGSMDIRVHRALAVYLQNRTPKFLEELKNLRNRGEGDERLEDRALPFRAYGEALAASDDRRGAAAAFQRALEIDHRDFQAAWGLCRLAMAEGDPERALTHCRAAVALNPHFLPAADQAAAISEIREDDQTVIAVLAPLLARNPEHPSAIRRLARAYIRTNDAAHAAKLIEGEGDAAVHDSATRRYVQGLVDLSAGRLSDALTALSAAADELPNEPFVQLARADALMRDGKIDMAGGFYRRALVAGAGAEAGLGAARAWLMRERWTEAQASAAEALARAERDRARPGVVAQALALQAEALFASGEAGGRGRAAAALARALATAPDEPVVLITAGRLSEAEGRSADALGHYLRAVATRPESAEARYYLGRALLATRDRRDEGRDALEQAARLDRDGRFGTLAEQLLRRRP